MRDTGDMSVEVGDLFFQTFPEGGPWQLQAISRIQRNMVDPFEPLIVCTFYSVDRKTNTRRIKEALAGVGWLPWLIIGSTWIDKQIQPVENQCFTGRHFDLVIDQSTVTEFDALDRESIPGKGHRSIIPASAYRFGTTGVQCVGVRRGADPYAVIIPASVLTQFYVGSSTALAQAFFTGAFVHRLWSLYDTGVSREIAPGEFLIRLRPGFSLDDAWVLARFAAGRENGPERQMYQNTFRSLVAANAAGRSLALRASFPFEGPTRLEGYGIPIPHPDADKGHPPRFLLLQLDRCSGRFPFEKLRVEVETTQADTDEETEEKSGPRAIAPQKPKEPLAVVTNARPNDRMPPLSVRSPSVVHRFSDLADKPREVIDAPRRRAAANFQGFVPGNPAKLGATGPMSSEGSGVRRVQAITSDADPGEERMERKPVISASAGDFIKLLKALTRKAGVSNLASIALDDPIFQDGSYAFGGIPALDGKGTDGKGTWHLLYQEGKKERARLLLLAEFRYYGTPICIMDLEPRHHKDKNGLMLICSTDRGWVGLPALRKVITIMRSHRRLWGGGTKSGDLSKDLKTLEGVLVFGGVMHAKSREDEYAEAVLLQVHSLLGIEHTQATEQPDQSRAVG